jgi:hypothetical protein
MLFYILYTLFHTTQITHIYSFVILGIFRCTYADISVGTFTKKKVVKFVLDPFIIINVLNFGESWKIVDSNDLNLN